MPDQELTYLLKLLADTHGADEIQAALSKIKNEADGTADSSKKLGEATKDLADKQSEANQFSTLLHHNHRVLHQLFNQMAKGSVPGLGHALGAALRGPLGLALALAYGFHEVKEKIAETNKELDAFAALAADKGASIEDAMRKALVDTISNTRADAFKANLEKMSSALNDYNVQATNYATLQRELRNIELETTNAKDAMANKMDELAVKEKRMSQTQADLNRLARVEAAEKAKRDKDEADRSGSLQVKQQERFVLAENELDQLQKQKDAAGGKYKNVGNIEDLVGKMPKNLQDQFRQYGDTFDKAGPEATRAYLEEMAKKAIEMIGKEGGPDGKGATGFIQKKEEAQKKFDKLNAEAEKDRLLLERDKAAGATGSVLGIRGFNAEKSAAAAAAAKADLDATNKAIENQRNVSTQLLLRADSIKEAIAEEKTLTEKMKEVEKQIHKLDQEIELQIKINEAHRLGNTAVGGAQHAGNVAEATEKIIGYKPPGADSHTPSLGELLDAGLQQGKLTRAQAEKLKTQLVGDSEYIGLIFQDIVNILQGNATKNKNIAAGILKQG